MKTVILAGGRGTRLGSATERQPKPMTRIGGQPILWHIMSHFAQQGFQDFLVAAGYRHDCIRDWVQNELQEDWLVQVADTGLASGTGGRLRRLSDQLSRETFVVAYGDGLCDLSIHELLDFHRSHGQLATILAVHPPSRFGRLDLDGKVVKAFHEKGIDPTQWINGSIFVFEPQVLDFIDDDATMLEHAPMQRLAAGRHLIAFHHEGFWQCMDFPGEHEMLESLWQAGDAPWAMSQGPVTSRPTIPIHHFEASSLTQLPRGIQIVPRRRSSRIGRRVLVTGHRGYLGSILVPQLLDAGHQVHGLDSGLYRGCGFANEAAPRQSLRRREIPGHEMDVRDVDTDVLRGFDTVIHLAGLCNDPLGDLNPELTFDINHRAAVHLARRAKAAGVRHFLQASTCSIYGGADDGWLDEDSTPRPLTPYAESKLRVERDVSGLAEDSFCPTFFRMGTVYGLSPMLRGDLVVNNLVAYAATTGEILLKSLGTSWRPLLHVEDAARAFCTALECEPGSLKNVILNVGETEENYQVRVLAELIQQELPEMKIVFAAGATEDKRNYRVRCDRLRERMPSYRTRWTVPAGIRQLIAGYREASLTADSFHSHRFMRLRHIQQSLRNGRLSADLRPVDLMIRSRAAA